MENDAVTPNADTELSHSASARWPVQLLFGQGRRGQHRVVPLRCEPRRRMVHPSTGPHHALGLESSEPCTVIQPTVFFGNSRSDFTTREAGIEIVIPPRNS